MFKHLLFLALAALILVSGVACARNQNPDQLRKETAEATSNLKRDTKAVAEGVKEGLTSTSKRSIDLNTASKDDLASLPGVTARQVDRIVAERPFATTRQLVTRRVVSEDEYAQIQDRVTVTR
jgi:DNA uptake protein ComE-like DNA-binding protein